MINIKRTSCPTPWLPRRYTAPSIFAFDAYVDGHLLTCKRGATVAYRVPKIEHITLTGVNP